MSLLDDLGNKLQADGVGIVDSTVFMGSSATIPVGDGPYISLFETGGLAPSRVQNSPDVATVKPTVQIVVRALNPIDARAKSKEAYDSLDGIFNTVLSGTTYLSIIARQEPTDTGLDELNRVRFTFNIEVEKQP